MYIAHAGHTHIEEGINPLISQELVIGGVLLVVLLIVGIVVVYDMRKKSAKSKLKSQE